MINCIPVISMTAQTLPNQVYYMCNILLSCVLKHLSVWLYLWLNYLKHRNIYIAQREMSIINEGNIVYSILYAVQQQQNINHSIDRSIVGCFTELITAIKIKCKNEEKHTRGWYQFYGQCIYIANKLILCVCVCR